MQALRHPTLLEQGSLEALIMSVDLVCVTDWDREALVSSTILSVLVSLIALFRLRSTTSAGSLGSRSMLVVHLACSVTSSAICSSMITFLREWPLSIVLDDSSSLLAVNLTPFVV